MSIYDESLELHARSKGKLEVGLKSKVESQYDLSLIYTPGVSEACKKIAENKEDVYKYTIKSNSVAVITDGSAVLGLGDIGCEASLPVMEGKCALFKKFAGIDAFPICINTKNVDEFVNTVKLISPVFGGINLEDISAPRCFEIEKRLIEELDIPVFHDDQHGTAVVVLAGLINSMKVVGKTFQDSRFVVNGAGAAGATIAKLLIKYGAGDVVVCDSKGIIFPERQGVTENIYKKELADCTNRNGIMGGLADAMKGADVFIGVSAPNVVNTDMVATMAERAVVFALANPVPEIMPDDALKGGAMVVATGRSDLPNQINNVLVFPGIFRGALDSRRRYINDEIKIGVAEAIAELVESPNVNAIIPNVFDERVVRAVADVLGETG